VDFLQSAALVLFGGFVSFIGTLVYGRHSEKQRRQYQVRLLLRSERREVVARLLRAIGEYEQAVIAYCARRELLERGPSEWGEPPATRELELLFEEATMLADDGSELMNGIYSAYYAARMLPPEQRDASSLSLDDIRDSVRDGKDQLTNAMRTELGVGHWLSPEMRKALHQDE
jgi:hypothetical protein